MSKITLWLEPNMAGAGRCRAEKRRIRLCAGARRNDVTHLAPSVERFENGDAIITAKRRLRHQE
jgi:hypothetical protein